MSLSHLKQSDQGFTIMELIVATGVFIVLVIISFGIFAFSLKGQQRVLLQTRVDRESQLIMEVLAKKIRASQVDYDFYTSGITNPVSVLALNDISNTSYVFSLDLTPDAESLQISVDQVTPVPISSSQVQVTDIKFFIEPVIDPFIPGQIPDTQPRVTMVLTIGASKGQFQVESVIEQTVPQRSGAF